MKRYLSFDEIQYIPGPEVTVWDCTAMTCDGQLLADTYEWEDNDDLLMPFFVNQTEIMTDYLDKLKKRFSGVTGLTMYVTRSHIFAVRNTKEMSNKKINTLVDGLEY